MRLLDTIYSDPLRVGLYQLTERDTSLIAKGYALLLEAMGEHLVEDFDSFCGTVSTTTDSAVSPKIVCALCRDEVVGIAIGSYLKNISMGFMCYAGVKVEWRDRGIYGAIRTRLIGLLGEEAGNDGLQFVLSEQDETAWLFQQYVRRWNAFVLPCDYEQPAVQGLQATTLKLVAQPVTWHTPPDKDEVVTIIQEIYSRIYRIPDVTENDSFHRIVASLHRPTSARSPAVT